MTVEDRRSPKPASPAVAAFLSFVLPGLGQIAVGAIRRGLILGLPLVAVIVLGLLLFLFDKGGLIAAMVRPEVVLALVILDLVLGVIHFIAIGDAYRIARRRVSRSAWQLRAGAPSLLAFLLVLTVGLHGGLGAIGFDAYNTMETIYPQPQSSFSIPIPSFGVIGTPAPGATPTPAPIAGPDWARDGRLNILLIGGDAGPGRWNLRTDTMILFSADVATGKVAMFGIPRNLYNVPLAPESARAFPGGIFPYPNLLNALWVYADGHRKLFPGGDDAGFRAITGAVQQLVGVPLDGAVVVKLNGFVRLVDALGGVWINVPFKMVDHAYPMEDGSGHVTMTIKAGCQKLDGHYALAFARIRHIDSDYGRMGRQQKVLDALARQLDPLAVLTKLPDLLHIAGTNLKTTFTPDDAGSLAQFATTMDIHHIKHVLFTPPKYRETLTSAEIARIQSVVQSVFVVKPKPSPTPAPTLNPSAKPTPLKTPAPTAVPCPAS
jgi:LCP family protein required for cell wall assembly